MRKNVFGRQFKRDKNQRKALFKGLLSALVLHERIKTTHAKAKAIKADADKLVTKAKKGGIVAYKALEPDLPHDAVKKLIDEIAPRFADRQGGYTRITKIGTRGKDNASMAMMEWTVLSTTSAALAVTKSDGASKKLETVESTAKVAAPKKKAVKKESKPKAIKEKTEKKPAKKGAKNK